MSGAAAPAKERRPASLEPRFFVPRATESRGLVGGVYWRPCLTSLSRNVDGFMPSASAAAVLFPPLVRRASTRSCFSAKSMAALKPPLSVTLLGSDQHVQGRRLGILRLGGPQVVLQQFRGNLSTAHQPRSFQRVVQLAHVAGPVVAAKHLDAPGRPSCTARSPRNPPQQVGRQRRDIVEPGSQRRNAQTQHIEPIVQVLAKGTVRRLCRAG